MKTLPNRRFASSVSKDNVLPQTFCGSKKLLGSLALALAFLVPRGTLDAAGPEPIDLGSAAHFTILAGAAITTTGGGIIRGDVGAYPISGASIHLTDAQVDGTIYASDATGPAGSVVDPGLLLAAKGDLTTAYNAAAGRTPVPTGPFLNPGNATGNIGGYNLAAGLYKFTDEALITGSDVTLTGGPNDVWIFQIATALKVGAPGGPPVRIILAGGAQARNIFWQVGTSATIETFCVFKGTIMADQAIVLKTSSTMEGRALAFSAGVTFNGTGGCLPTSEAPRFTKISWMEGGDVTLELKTTAYSLVTLQTSTDMVPGSWSTIATNTPVTDQWTFIHEGTSPTGPRRFYRAFLATCPD